MNSCGSNKVKIEKAQLRIIQLTMSDRALKAVKIAGMNQRILTELLQCNVNKKAHVSAFMNLVKTHGSLNDFINFRCTVRVSKVIFD